MSSPDPVDTYVHPPGNPVLDRTAARLSVTNRGPVGHAIARGDRAVVVATGRAVIITDVDHQTGRVQARPQRAGRPARTPASTWRSPQRRITRRCRTIASTG